MISHTPGPWFVHDFADPAVSPDPSPEDVTVSCDHPATITVASMGRAMTATLDEARANARLIAAAPDMLEALRRAEQILTNVMPLGATLVAVRHAIAKAQAI